jgi:hypothetical protein
MGFWECTDSIGYSSDRDTASRKSFEAVVFLRIWKGRRGKARPEEIGLLLALLGFFA